MPTVKLVVIGASGVGKTSLRGKVGVALHLSPTTFIVLTLYTLQYISGRFSDGYRATIGADFITKTLPHPNNPAESVTLQIWVGY